MAEDRIVAALDIGTTKVFVLVGEMDEHGDVYVIGHGQAAADGLRRGVVVNMDKSVQSIRKAVEDAEMTSGTEIDRVTVGMAGEHVHSINSHGVVAVTRPDNEITAADVRKAIEASSAVAIPVDREIIHVIPQVYSVDDQGGIKDPTGMSGVRLEVESHIVTASVTSAKNIFRALERCHLSVDHMVLEGLAESTVLLTEDEMESGCAIVDIGGEMTNASLYFDGAIRHTSVVPLGGRNVTNDIAIGLRTSVDQAEEMKLAFGAALASAVDPTEMIDVPAVAGRAGKSISRNVLASIIEPRMEEIFSLVNRGLKTVHRLDMFTAGLILTGGGSILTGTLELAEQIFDMPVRRGSLRKIKHTPEELDSGPYSSAHGLLVYGFENEPVDEFSGGVLSSFLKKVEQWITKRL
ncbi:MAG: cell division protein FtsA [Candidatus Zixiibacteriota bacterium]|nr:MAG: cell division protein FtsA [candidate division Zixibacteria bacterium]